MGGNRNIGHKLAFRLQNSRSVSRSMLLLLIICSIVLWICVYKDSKFYQENVSFCYNYDSLEHVVKGMNLSDDILR